MEYKGIDQEAILKRDMETITKYRIKKNKGFQYTAKILVAFVVIGILLYFASYLCVDMVAQACVFDQINMPVMVSGILVFFISFISLCIVYSRVQKKTLNEVRKEYDL